MAHTTQEELNAIILRAKEQIQVGETYVHYKDANQPYKVIDIGLLESTEEPTVIYKAQYGAHISWVRPLTNFIEQIENNGKKVARFQRKDVT